DISLGAQIAVRAGTTTAAVPRSVRLNDGAGKIGRAIVGMYLAQRAKAAECYILIKRGGTVRRDRSEREHGGDGRLWSEIHAELFTRSRRPGACRSRRFRSRE